MAYCVQCGKAVTDADRFCGGCGASQPASKSPLPPRADPWNGISDRNVRLFCYIPWLGWIASIAVLATERFRRDDRARFHAFQGLYLFAAWVLVDWLISPALFGFVNPIRTIERLAKLAVLGAWVFMIIRVSHDDDYHLPILGELAERSVSEQRP